MEAVKALHPDEMSPREALDALYALMRSCRSSRVSLGYCKPTGRANARPMTGSAKQSIWPQGNMDCFVASLLATTEL